MILVPQQQQKTLPKEFSQQLLATDITLVMSGYTDYDALHQLINLYMKGVEYFESQKDRKHEYFKIKLQWLMNHPNVVQDKKKKSVEKASIQKQMINIQPKKDNFIPFKNIQPSIRDQIQRSTSQNTSQKLDEKPSRKLLFSQQQEQNITKFHFEGTQNLTKFDFNGQDNKSLPKVEETDEPQESQYVEERVSYMHQQIKQEIFIQDDKKEVKNMLEKLQQETDQIQIIIKDDIDSQTKNITDRLRQRSITTRIISKVNSQPLLQPLSFNQKPFTQLSQDNSLANTPILIKRNQNDFDQIITNKNDQEEKIQSHQINNIGSKVNNF